LICELNTWFGIKFFGTQCQINILSYPYHLSKKWFFVGYGFIVIKSFIQHNFDLALMEGIGFNCLLSMNIVFQTWKLNNLHWYLIIYPNLIKNIFIVHQKICWMFKFGLLRCVLSIGFQTKGHHACLLCVNELQSLYFTSLKKVVYESFDVSYHWIIGFETCWRHYLMAHTKHNNPQVDIWIESG